MLTAEKHPQADKLQVLTVDAGPARQSRWCAARPTPAPAWSACSAPPGAYIPGSDLTLKVAAIRGVESRGMMCSSRELELGDDHSGIIELPDDAPVGTAFAEYAGLDDPVFDVERHPQPAGLHGRARDCPRPRRGGHGHAEAARRAADRRRFPCPVPVTIEDPEGCPAFFGRAIAASSNGPSPEWMQRRLKAAGQRPISALVDITNYVMLDHRPAGARL